MTKELQFPVSEYAARMEKARALMKASGLCGLLVGTGPNLTYFSGYPSPPKSASRPFILLLPLEAEPALVVQDGRRFEAERFSWFQDVRTYRKLSRLPKDLLIDLLREKEMDLTPVGIELGNEMEPNYPVWELRDLSASLPDVAFTDASKLLWELRMVKSLQELDLVRRACAITTRAYARSFPQLRAGMSEADCARLLAMAHLEEGGSNPRALVTSGSGNYDLVSKAPGRRQIQPGDMIWFDAGCSVGGYNSDFSRAAVVGKASDSQRRATEAVNRATEAGVAMVGPGVGVADVARASNRALDGSGLSITSSISGLAARIGHGLGLVVTELPSVSEADDTIMRPGMAITVEPAVATVDGTFHHEQNVIVTDDGHELISLAPVELFEIL